MQNVLNTLVTELLIAVIAGLIGVEDINHRQFYCSRVKCYGRDGRFAMHYSSIIDPSDYGILRY